MSPGRFEAFAVPDADTYGPLGPIRAGPADAGIEYVGPEWTQASVARLLAELTAAGSSLKARPLSEIVDALGRVGARFGTEGDALRERALECLPAGAGYSVEMARAVLDGMARDWTRERLLRLVEAEFEKTEVLDGFVGVRGRDVMAVGPRLCTQIVSGSVPGVTVSALIRSLLVKSPTLIKPGLGDIVLPVLFAGALAEEDPAIASALAVVYWPGGTALWEEPAVTGSDLVVAYGSDATISEVRSLTAPTTRFIGYHNRVSVAAIGRRAMTSGGLKTVARDVAGAVAMFDQRGCVCPGTVFVEEGGERGSGHLAEAIAAALAEAEVRLPAGRLDDQEVARLQQFRGMAELGAATGEARLFDGGEDATWTVVHEPEPGPAPGCLGRTVRIRSITDASELGRLLVPAALHLQTIGVAGFGERLHGLAEEWGRLGASRVVPLREMSFPPPWWYHDGRGPLQDLVRWVEVDEG
jgi:hypothetical protein